MLKQERRIDENGKGEEYKCQYEDKQSHAKIIKEKREKKNE